MVNQHTLAVMYEYQPDHTSLVLDGKGDAVPGYVFTREGLVVEVRGVDLEMIDRMHEELEDHRIPFLDIKARPSAISKEFKLVHDGQPVVLGADLATQKIGPVEIEARKRKLVLRF
jgi:hypothetical protein